MCMCVCAWTPIQQPLYAATASPTRMPTISISVYQAASRQNATHPQHQNDQSTVARQSSMIASLLTDCAELARACISAETAHAHTHERAREIAAHESAQAHAQEQARAQAQVREIVMRSTVCTLARSLTRESESAQEVLRQVGQATIQQAEQEAACQMLSAVKHPTPSQERGSREWQESEALADYQGEVQACIERLRNLEEASAAREWERECHGADVRRADARPLASDARHAGTRDAAGVVPGNPSTWSPASRIEGQGVVLEDIADLRLQDMLIQTVQEYRYVCLVLSACMRARGLLCEPKLWTDAWCAGN
jgi:hypothetical protein